jgi:hypothetical protein
LCTQLKVLSLYLSRRHNKGLHCWPELEREMRLRKVQLQEE